MYGVYNNYCNNTFNFDVDIRSRLRVLALSRRFYGSCETLVDTDVIFEFVVV